MNGEEDFPTLRPSEILFTAGVNLKLQYTFYVLAKGFRVLSSDQKLSCSDIWALGNTNRPETSLQAQYLTFTR